MNTNYGNDGWDIYWEKQGSDRLCGQHCLNSLMQGPFYTEVGLAQIAQELDEQEKNLFAQGGVDTKDFQRFMGSPSNNVADDGNYSIQVISEALKRTADLGVESIDSTNAKNAGDLSKETGFICNSSSHWFAIRKVDNKWWNLNSTNREGPEYISDFYLSAFLNSVRENGYTIFVIVGNYPITSTQMFPDLQRHQKWFTEKECMALHERNLKKKNYQLNIDGTDERDLQAAIEKSKKEYENSQKDDFEFEDEGGVSSKFGNVNEEENQNKFQAFQGQGFSLTNQSNQGHKDIDNYFEKWRIQNEDPELGFAMLLSVKDEFSNRPKADDNHVTLNFRLPTGASSNFTFNKLKLVETLYDFVKTSLSEDQTYQFIITSAYPRKQLTNLQITLEEAGIQDMDSLIVEKQS